MTSCLWTNARPTYSTSTQQAIGATHGRCHLQTSALGTRSPARAVCERAPGVCVSSPYLTGILDPRRELTGFFMSQNASVFNSTCRIFAPRYRQATLSSFLDVDTESGRRAMDGAYADVRAAFQHYLSFQNQGRPFLIASHSQGGWHAIRLLQEFVEAKPLAEKFVAAYCLGSWLPEAMFLGESAPFRQVF